MRRVDTLTRWHADPSTMVADAASPKVLLEVPQTHSDHGGALEFGADGMLYIGVGAGTGDATAQDPTTLPGSVLRLDVSATGAYRTPADTPFNGTNGRKEVWSYGYRNPFRLHADSELGIIVSEPMFREKDQQVSIATRGGNAGYPALTQTRTCWSAGRLAPGCGPSSGIPGLVPPVLEYPASVGQIVSGAITSPRGGVELLRGKVLVSDWEGVFLLATPAPSPWRHEPITLTLPEAVASDTVWAMDVDANGTVYALVTDDDSSEGAVLRLRG